MGHDEKSLGTTVNREKKVIGQDRKDEEEVAAAYLGSDVFKTGRTDQ